MEDSNFRKGDAKTEVFGSNRMLAVPSSHSKLKVMPRQQSLARKRCYKPLL